MSMELPDIKILVRLWQTTAYGWLRVKQTMHNWSSCFLKYAIMFS